VVFYFHPWEIDPDQPRMPAGVATRLRHYGGLAKTAGRLERLLRDFRFDTASAVLNLETAQASPRAAAAV
jgi:hypothetical protein